MKVNPVASLGIGLLAASVAIAGVRVADASSSTRATSLQLSATRSLLCPSDGQIVETIAELASFGGSQSVEEAIDEYFGLSGLGRDHPMRIALVEEIGRTPEGEQTRVYYYSQATENGAMAAELFLWVATHEDGTFSVASSIGCRESLYPSAATDETEES